MSVRSESAMVDTLPPTNVSSRSKIGSLTADLVNLFVSSPAELPSLIALSSPRGALGADEKPELETYVLVSLVEGEDVRLGTARYSNASISYKMEGGSLELPLSRRGPDGIFVSEGKQYLVLSKEEFAARKKASKAAMRTASSSAVDAEVVPAAAPVSAAKHEALAQLDQSLGALPALNRARMSPHAMPFPPASATGCPMHDSFKTVFVVSDLYGQSKRLNVVLARVKDLAIKAKRNGNQVHFAFLGNSMPDRYASDEDMGVTLLEYSREGIPELEIGSEGVHIIAGERELRYLRLADRDADGEVTADTKHMATVLATRSPLTGVAEFRAYDQALSEALRHGVPTGEEELCVAMWLKLEALASMALRFEYLSPDAPGLIRNLLARHSSKADTPAVDRDLINMYLANNEMRCFPDDTAWIARQLKKFVPNRVLSKEGRAFAPFCKLALSKVTAYVKDVVLPLLSQSKLIDLLSPPSYYPMEQGLWLMHAGTAGGSCVCRLPSDVDVLDGAPIISWKPDPVLLLPWMNMINAFLYRAAVKGSSDDLRIMSALSLSSSGLGLTQSLSPSPLKGLKTEGQWPAIGAVGNVPHPFAMCQRTLDIIVDTTVPSFNKSPTSWWVNVDTSAYAPSTAWAALSWCHDTQALLLPPEPQIDRSVSLSDWQFDVNCTLLALVQYAEPGDPMQHAFKPWEKTLDAMSGTIGPIVQAGRNGQELLRAVLWTACASSPESEHRPPDVLTLLPEAYLRHVLVDYYTDVHPGPLGWRCLGATAGFLVLPDEHIVPMRVPDLSATEELHAAKAMGDRIWRVPKRNGTLYANHDSVLKEMAAAPPEWRELLQYDVYGAPEQKAFTPGKQIKSAAGRRVFYTCTSTRDPLSGVVLRWTFAPGDRDMPTLDVDNRPGGRQAELETVRGS